MIISKELAEIIGIHVGDGCISINKNYSEYAISGDINEEREYYDTVVTPLYNEFIFYPLLGKNIFPKEYFKNGTYGIIVFNKRVTNYFLKLGLISGSKLDCSIPKVILQDKNTWVPFLRGLFDTDGSIYFNKNYSTKVENRKHNRPRIKLGLTSEKVIYEVYFILKNLNFAPYLKPAYKGKRDKNPVYSIILQRVKDVNRFVYEIGFNNSKHMTKWKIYKKLGYCPPNTTIIERYRILSGQKIYNTQVSFKTLDVGVAKRSNAQVAYRELFACET
jgi:intein/homing endonuclease